MCLALEYCYGPSLLNVAVAVKQPVYTVGNTVDYSRLPSPYYLYTKDIVQNMCLAVFRKLILLGPTRASF